METKKPCVVIQIARTGEVKIETTGFTGSACHDATKRLQEKLGTTTADEVTPEYHEQAELTHEAAAH